MLLSSGYRQRPEPETHFLAMDAIQKPSAPIRVFLVSDHHLMLWGLERLIGEAPDFQVTGSAASCAEALEKPDRAASHIVLVDLDMAPDQVIESIPGLRGGDESKILLLTRGDDPATHDRAVLAGARGIVKRQTPPDMLLGALAKVHEGQIWLDRETTSRIFAQITSRVAKTLPDPERQRIASLTERELEIVTFIGEHCGVTGKAIASRLHISASTLRNHLTSIYDKLGVANRHGLLAYAIRNNLAKPGG